MARRQGFTLLEVLVSLAILAGVFLLAFRVVSGALAAQARAEREIQAALLGDRLLREAAASFPEVQETSGRFAPPDDAFAWKLVVRQAVHPDAREVHVTVTWTAGDRPESVTLSGLAVR